MKKDHYIQPRDEEESLIDQDVANSHALKVPECINECRGITIFGKTIKSIVVTTDVAIICNINADAVMAVYPFSPQSAVIKAVLSAAHMPVFAGVGGGTTRGVRTWNMANNAEQMGAVGVVVNSPIDNDTITGLLNIIDIPVIVTVVSEDTDIEARLNAGASIFNVSGAEKTADIVRKIREKHPEVRIIATGGPTEETIRETIAAGADAITYTPPSSLAMIAEKTAKYRHNETSASLKKQAEAAVQV